MEENKKKVSSREAWRLHRRAAKLFYAERPALHAVNWLYAAFKSLSPYVLIYLSAQIIGELLHLREHVGGNEDGAAAGRRLAEVQIRPHHQKEGERRRARLGANPPGAAGSG